LTGRDIPPPTNASTKIGEFYRSLLEEFDLVLIDCPPGLTLFSEAALSCRRPDYPNVAERNLLAALDHLRNEIGGTRPDRTLEDLLVGTVISKLSDRAGGAPPLPVGIHRRLWIALRQVSHPQAVSSLLPRT
jgi:hypothetical protein